MVPKRVGYGCHLLTHTEPIVIVFGASAQSDARTLNPVSKRRSGRQQSGFFCCGYSAPAVFMVGLLGPTSVGPVSFCTGVENPVSPASNQNSQSGWQALLAKGV